jgi:cardiolipin hydrolase
MLDTAQQTMHGCVFTITNNALRDALVRAHDRGVQVKVISDDECMKQQGSDIYDMKAYGIPCESDTDPEAHMHNKFVVIDGQVLITGSFNWTVAAAGRNQENLIFLQDADLSQAYIQEFDRLWASFIEVSSAGHSRWTEGHKVR